MRVTKFESKTIRCVADDARAVLSVIADKYGLELEHCRSSATATEMAFKVRFKVPAGTQPADFEDAAKKLGLPPGLYGKQVLTPYGGLCTLVALYPRRHKYPVTLRDRRGNECRYPLSVLNDIIPKKPVSLKNMGDSAEQLNKLLDSLCDDEDDD